MNTIMKSTITHYIVADVHVTDDSLIANVDKSAPHTDIETAIASLPGGKQSGDMYAVWKFEDHQPSQREMDEAINLGRPWRIFVRAANGQLVEMSDSCKAILQTRTNNRSARDRVAMEDQYVCDEIPSERTPEEKINAVLASIMKNSEAPYEHHARYAIDQVVRILTDCPEIIENVPNGVGGRSEKRRLGSSEKYIQFLDAYEDECAGVWDSGIKP